MPKGDNLRKLSVEQVAYILSRLQRGICQTALAVKFKVSRQRINQLSKLLTPFVYFT